MSEAIEARGLSKAFGDVQAVEDVSLTVERGEMLGLVGPDGGGKTTTIRMLAGVLATTTGEATLLGYDLATQVDEIKQRVGYLSQQFSLYGDLSIDENIEFFAQIHDVVDFADRREELLEFTRLTSFRDRLAERLSGGMKQKLALACTLIHAPELILLDEPTTGVDPVSRRDFWLILADLLRRDITIVMTTPYLDEAARCNRVALMHEGRIITTDTPHGISATVRGVMLEVRSDSGQAAYAAIRQAMGDAEAQVFGRNVHVLVADDDAAAARDRVARALESAGIRSEIDRIAPTLEDAFIQLVGGAGSAAQRDMRDSE